MTLALVLAHWKNVVIVAAVLTMVGFCHARDQAIADRAVARRDLAAVNHALDSTAALKRGIDTLVVHDLKTITRTIASVDTLRDSVLKHLTDTVLVERFVTRTDSALRACSALANDCAAFRSLTATREAAFEAKIHALENGAIVRRRWYDGRLSIGPCAGIGRDGKTFWGACGSVSVLRWP